MPSEMGLDVLFIARCFPQTFVEASGCPTCPGLPGTFPAVAPKVPYQGHPWANCDGASPWEAPMMFGAGDADVNTFPTLVLIGPTVLIGSGRHSKNKCSVPGTAEEHLQ